MNKVFNPRYKFIWLDLIISVQDFSSIPFRCLCPQEPIYTNRSSIPMPVSPQTILYACQPA
jgi:hypothetical protein